MTGAPPSARRGAERQPGKFAGHLDPANGSRRYVPPNERLPGQLPPARLKQTLGNDVEKKHRKAEQETRRAFDRGRPYQGSARTYRSKRAPASDFPFRQVLPMNERASLSPLHAVKVGYFSPIDSIFLRSTTCQRWMTPGVTAAFFAEAFMVMAAIVLPSGAKARR